MRTDNPLAQTEPTRPAAGEVEWPVFAHPDGRVPIRIGTLTTPLRVHIPGPAPDNMQPDAGVFAVAVSPANGPRRLLILDESLDASLDPAVLDRSKYVERAEYDSVCQAAADARAAAEEARRPPAGPDRALCAARAAECLDLARGCDDVEKGNLLVRIAAGWRDLTVAVSVGASLASGA